MVFGVRIFNNLANIRRVTIDKYVLKRMNNFSFKSVLGIESGENKNDAETEPEEDVKEETKEKE